MLIDHLDNTVKRLGHELRRPTREMFRLWGRCRDGTLDRAEFPRLMNPIRHRIDSLLPRGVCGGYKNLRGMCAPPRGHRERLWTVLDVEGVVPTNNSSERTLRPAVIWRKLSFGTQCVRGSRFVETILTAVEACRRQSRNCFRYLAAALRAHFAAQPAPSLLTGA